MFGLLHQPHFVNLIGYCAYKDQRLLVYANMLLGCLEHHLRGTYFVLGPHASFPKEDVFKPISHPFIISSVSDESLLFISFNGRFGS